MSNASLYKVMMYPVLNCRIHAWLCCMLWLFVLWVSRKRGSASKMKRKFPKWVTCVVDGVDMLVVGIKRRGCKE